MKKSSILFLLLALAVGCSMLSPIYKIAKDNKNHMNNLSTGMTQEELLRVMGRRTFNLGKLTVTNPYRSENLTGASGDYQVIYYVTSVELDDDIISDNELTPFVFYENKLIGWGWDYLAKVR